jgi:transposase
MFMVEQKVGKHIYVYEVYSYWDKEKKGARQRRIPVGKKDPKTGMLIANKSKCISREYGPVYFIASLIEQYGLDDLLKYHFPDHWREIILSASFQVAEHNPFYLCNSWLERIYLKDPISLPSQRLSEIIHDIGCDERAVFNFLNEWTNRNHQDEYMAFDITSLSTYSKNIEFAERGYNRDGDNLPQVNLGMVYNIPGDLPLLYSIYPGSIPDVVTFENMEKRLATITPKGKILFVLDRGFYSTKNLLRLTSFGKFIIPLPIRTKVAKELIDSVKENIQKPANAFQLDKQLLYSLPGVIELENAKYNAHVYFSERRKSDETERLVSRLLNIEETVSEHKWKSSKSLIRFLENNYSDWKKYYRLAEKGSEYTISKKNDKIDAATERHGYFFLLTNTDLSAKKALSYYRNRDSVEKIFNSLKHGIDQHRLRVHSQESAEGMLFIDFVSLILYSGIQRGLRQSKLNKKYTVEQLFYELRKLSIIELGSKRPMLSELTKKQKDIFEGFGIPQPAPTVT